MNRTPEDILRAALSAPADPDDWVAHMARASLLEHAGRDERNHHILAEHNRQGRAELDLHVEGMRIANHEGPAQAVGDLLKRTSTAVNELAKQIVGKRRRKESLRVVALAPGSLRVLLRAPELTQPAHKTDSLPGSESESAEESALRQLASIILQASEGHTAVAASLAALHGKPRMAVRQVAQVVLKNGWSLEGELRLRNQDPLPVRLTTEDAGRIIDAALETDEDFDTQRLEGKVDGWIWSLGTMYFAQESGPRLPAVVAPELQTKIAELNARQADVSAFFRVLISRPHGDRTTEARSYVLEDVREIARDTPMPLGEIAKPRQSVRPLTALEPPPVDDG